jgi:hypothetical protein
MRYFFAFILAMLAPAAVAEPTPLNILPFVRWCGDNVHVWSYTVDFQGRVDTPGVSCTGANCLPELEAIGKIKSILSAPNPASAASAAITGGVQFYCNAAVSAEQTPRGALCRERFQFVQANLPAVGRSASRWKRIAGEGETMTFTSATEVRYGTGTTWFEANMNGTGQCSNAMFGDPAPGLAKECQVIETVVVSEPTCTVPPPPPPPVVAYVVSTAQAFPLTATGAKSNTPWPTAPILGEPCDTSVKVTSYGVAFYRVPRLSVTQTVVAGCKAKP